MASPPDSPITGNGTPTPPFDPFHQSIVLLDSHGEQTPPITLDMIDYWAQFAIRTAIVWGSQIGAAFITLIMLLILTKREKRRSILFILNGIILFLCIFRAITNVLIYTTSWYSFYVLMVGDFSRIPQSDYANSILATTTTQLMVICIQVSLVMQANIICGTARRPLRFAIMTLSVLFALAVILVRIWQTVVNNKQTMGYQTPQLPWLADFSTILLCSSLCFFSLMFCAKLGLAIRNRRKLGLKQFGPMQIVFIMATQTLIIPSKHIALAHSYLDHRLP